MTISRVAQGIATLGRHGDSTLLHVNPNELAGLESLVGRKLTTNPHTGMKEAFGWEDLLPIAAGVVGTVASGGNPIVGGLAAGATRAGVSGAQGKGAGTALTDGLMTGVTSYATGSLLQGVGSAANAAEPAATAATGSATAGAAPGAATGLAGAGADGLAATATTVPQAAVEGAATTAPLAAPAAAAAPPGPEGAAGLAGTGPEGSAALAAQQNLQAFNAQSYGDQAADVGRGITNPKLLGQYAMDHPGQALGTLGGAYQLYSSATAAEPYTPPAQAPSRFVARPTTVRQPTMPGADYRPGYSAETRYFAVGGPVSPFYDGKPKPTPAEEWAAWQASQAGLPGNGGMSAPGMPTDMGAVAPAAAAAPSGMTKLVMPGANYQPGKDGQWTYFQPADPVPVQPGQAAMAPVMAPPRPMMSGEDGGGGAGGGGGADGGGSYRAGGPIEGRGLASLSGGNMPSHGDTMALVEEAKAALLGQHPNPEAVLSRFAARFGPHALTALQAEMAKAQGGGPVSGPGGGMDDQVPATIEGQQPAKLSDGEFVIPSDAVSGLGDGSTKEGIARLDGMVDRIRQARTGREAQPRRVTPAVMPA